MHFSYCTADHLFARDVLKIGPSGFGVLMGTFGTGAVVAGLLVAFLGTLITRAVYVMRFVFVFVGDGGD